MLKRTTIYSLLAAATLTVAAVVTSSVADARPGPGNGAGVSRGGGGHGIARLNVRPSLGRGQVNLRRPIQVRRSIHLRPRLTIIRPGCFRNPWLCRPIARPNFCWRHPWRCQRPIVIGRYPVVGAYPVAAAAVTAAPLASAPCTCLRKTYLPNGAVLFQDVCTNEAAVNPPQQAAEVPQK